MVVNQAAVKIKPINSKKTKNSRLLSTAKYASHSRLTRQNQKTEFLQKTRTLDLKIQKKISPTCIALINSRKHERKCCQPKDEKKITQKCIRED